MDTIFFDLDGTLTDPKPGITGSIQYALEKLGQPVPTQDELTWCIGPPLHQSFTTLLGHDRLSQQAIAFYRERFGDVGLYENRVYDGIVATLAELQQRGHRMFVATSKVHIYAERIIDHFELRRYFERVFGAELDGTRGEKTDLLRYALTETSTDPARAWMIGDRKHDMIGARKNGLRAIGVLYGYGSAAELTEFGAHQLCATPAGIPDVLR